MEKTFVMLKPDCVEGGHVGECIGRFEKAGLKVMALQMRKINQEFANKHYPSSEEWFKSVGAKSIEAYSKMKKEVRKYYGTNEPLKIGKIIKQRAVNYVCSGPVVAIALEGNDAIATVRKIIGHTFPNRAEPGTIRRDFSNDSIDAAEEEKRSVYNVVHASGNKEEAENELKLWFENKFLEYDRK